MTLDYSMRITKFSKTFKMNDRGKASFVLAIEIHRYRSHSVLAGQRAYIDHVLKRFSIHNCSPRDAHIIKYDKFSKSQFLKNELEKEATKQNPYVSIIGSLVYAQVYTRFDIACVVSVRGRFQSNPMMEHWTAVKKIMRYLQCH